MFLSRSSIPFEQEASGRVLPSLIAFMVFLAAFGLAITLALNNSMTYWDKNLIGKMTVQIVPSGINENYDLNMLAVNARNLILQSEGVASATILSRSELEALLEPWFSQGTLNDDLPIPPLIDISLDPEVKMDTATLSKLLEREIPGAVLDDHKRWLDKLMALGNSIQIIACAIVFMIGLASIAMVVFATRADLATHHDTIEVLHLMGARDSYIANHFQRRALWLGLRGGLVGVALALATFLALAELAHGLDMPFLPRLNIEFHELIALGAIPFAAAAITTFATRITVIQSLRRLV